jgi:hypothetical protein
VDHDRDRYGRYFAAEPGHKLLVEASPNYLGYKENVAPRVRALLPDARLLFILRNPADRLYSHYHFAVGKLELSDRLPFEEYVDLCVQYTAGERSARAAGIAEKHLRAFEIGFYARHLKNYTELFPAARVKIAFFEHLKRDPLRFMMDVSSFAGIDPNFYQNYGFSKINVTFSARLKPLHFLALILNRALEPMLRQRPRLKAQLVRLYKRWNQGSEGYVPMADATRARLAEYYAPSIQALKALLSDQELPPWVR